MGSLVSDPFFFKDINNKQTLCIGNIFGTTFFRLCFLVSGLLTPISNKWPHSVSAEKHASPKNCVSKPNGRCSETKIIHREKETIAEEKNFQNNAPWHAHMDTHLFAMMVFLNKKPNLKHYCLTLWRLDLKNV